MKYGGVLGTGSYLPKKVLSNHDLEKLVETSDEWITSRTGIRTRRIAGQGEEVHQMAAEAGRRALAQANVGADELDLVVVATVSGPMSMPSCACFVQAALGAKRAFAFDLNAACSGFLYGLDLVSHYLRSRPEMKILLIGAEALSSRLNWEDRNTCILFGDGAGACVLGNREEPGIQDANLFADGSLWELLYMHGPDSLNAELHQPDYPGAHLQMSGRDVFKHAVRAMEDAVKGLLERNNLHVSDIDLLVPHQANIRILNKLRERLGFEAEKVYINVDRYGNTSAASIPIALDEAHRQGKMKRGELVLLCSFGGGFTWGALLMYW